MFSSPGVTPSRSESSDDRLDALLTAVVRGEVVPAAGWTGVGTDAWLGAAEQHGLVPLLADRLSAQGDMPTALAQATVAEARRYAAADLAREVALRRLLVELAKAGVRPLLFKGAQLAYSHYGRPDLRPRLDTDLFVADVDRPAVAAVLTRLGYHVTGDIAGTLLMYQACYVAPDHVVDVHWKLANTQVFAELVSYEDLALPARPLAALGPGAFGLADPDALLVACVHRVAHHRDSDRLIWLYDIHLLASRLSEADWRVFATLCEARGVVQVRRRGLERAAAAFGTVVPAAFLAVAPDPASRREAATSAFLDANRRHVRLILDDLRALPSWRDRVRLLGEHAFPSPVYMRENYAPASSAPLAVLYVRRAVQGAWKWLARP